MDETTKLDPETSKGSGGLSGKLWKDRSTKGKIGVVIGALFVLGLINNSLGESDSQTDSAAPVASTGPTTQAGGETTLNNTSPETTVTLVSATATETTTPPTAPPQTSAEPEGLELFLTIVRSYNEEYRAAGTDLQRADIRIRRNEALCAAFPDRRVTDWVGKVDDVRGNSDGDASVDIEVARHINLATWGNRFSDVGDRTLIKRDDPIYPTLISLSKGDTVVFSGEFLRSSRDCIATKNLTETFGMSRPDFLFRFSSVVKK